MAAAAPQIARADERPEPPTPPSPSAPTSLAVICDALNACRDTIHRAVLDETRHTTAAAAALSDQLKLARHALRETELERDQAVARAEKCETLQLLTSEALREERERRSAAEAAALCREASVAEVRAALRAAEERLRASEEKEARLRVLLDEAREETRVKAREKREAHEAVERWAREEAERRRTPRLEEAAPAPSLAEEREALGWAQGVVDALSSRIDLSGRQFVLMCAALFTALGFTAHVIDGPGDRGVDIRLVDRAERLCLVQCKCKGKKYKVQRDEVESFATAVRNARSTEDVASCIFVTTTEFTELAPEVGRREIGEGVAVVLWGREALVALLARQREALRDSAALGSILELYTAPPVHRAASPATPSAREGAEEEVEPILRELSLRPNGTPRRMPWSEEEEHALLEAVAVHGEKWSAIMDDEHFHRFFRERFVTKRMTRQQGQMCLRDKWRQASSV
ncbi:hypothetical protein AB1Y20_016433 [Prymnesium parvum]|uniref:Restriction endonuclease type IV Mrr domain-containing protein n=1 Tax=Prymnesium parvum TaxID=97485 RepID=A0AB34IFV9_PRYPA